MRCVYQAAPTGGSCASSGGQSTGKGRGGEVTLPSIEALRDGDPMTGRVAEQIALGVSTRGYERSLESVGDSSKLTCVDVRSA